MLGYSGAVSLQPCTNGLDKSPIQLAPRFTKMRISGPLLVAGIPSDA